jgi:DeoR/GlpR family transcriptional regulator of sugar metabolism
MKNYYYILEGLMEARLRKIIEIVNKEKKVEVTRLSSLLGVSQVTIRKDLDFLEDKGLLIREHGFAVINDSDDLNNRLTINYDTKVKIARLGASIVADGETIMIESGSSCALLAEELAKTKKNITIITNSTFIASFIRNYEGCRIILLGGEYQKSSQVNVGPLINKYASDFFVDKLFVGIDGLSEESGFTAGDLMRAEAVKAMSQSADKILILTDSSKFAKPGLVKLFDFRDVDLLITDSKITPEHRILFEMHDIDIYTL